MLDLSKIFSILFQTWLLALPPPVGVRSIALSVSVCLSVRVSKKTTRPFRILLEVFCTCDLWPWFGPPLTTM